MDTEKLKQMFRKGLQILSDKHTEETLGDRSKYLGASDIGYCSRKVIMGRVEKCEDELVSLIRFKRGHISEDIVAEIFDSVGYSNYERQVEIDISTKCTPLLVHIDFVFTSEKHKVKSILEVKSGKIPENPYGNWESQLYLQMGALAEKYPDYEIRGAIISIDLGEPDIAFFNSYKPSDVLYKGLINQAEEIWDQYQKTLAGESVYFDLDPGPLCGYCNFIRSCPIYSEIEDYPHPDMDDYIGEYQGFVEKEKEWSLRVKGHKKSLYSTVKAIGPFRAGGYIFRETIRTRKSLNKVELEKFLKDNGTSLSEFEEISSYSFLDIKKAKKQKKAA